MKYKDPTCSNIRQSIRLKILLTEISQSDGIWRVVHENFHVFNYGKHEFFAYKDPYFTRFYVYRLHDFNCM